MLRSSSNNLQPLPRFNEYTKIYQYHASPAAQQHVHIPRKLSNDLHINGPSKRFYSGIVGDKNLNIGAKVAVGSTLNNL